MLTRLSVGKAKLEALETLKDKIPEDSSFIKEIENLSSEQSRLEEGTNNHSGQLKEINDSFDLKDQMNEGYDTIEKREYDTCVIIITEKNSLKNRSCDQTSGLIINAGN